MSQGATPINDFLLHLIALVNRLVGWLTRVQARHLAARAGHPEPALTLVAAEGVAVDETTATGWQIPDSHTTPPPTEDSADVAEVPQPTDDAGHTVDRVIGDEPDVVTTDVDRREPPADPEDPPVSGDAPATVGGRPLTVAEIPIAPRPDDLDTPDSSDADTSDDIDDAVPADPTHDEPATNDEPAMGSGVPEQTTPEPNDDTSVDATPDETVLAPNVVASDEDPDHPTPIVIPVMRHRRREAAGLRARLADTDTDDTAVPSLDDVTNRPTPLAGPAAAVTVTEPAATEPAATEPAATAATPPAVAPGRIRHALGLDGLRGIAVVAVAVYHFYAPAMPGGYLGVDIFFVLSGFLITSLLVRERGVTRTTSLPRFWQRRVRRILPAAVTVLVVCTAIAGLIGGDVAVALVEQFLGSLFFVNNWVQIAQSHSYFADTTPQIFMHYWSLAIEEQFYLVWPLLFIATLWVLRRLRLRTQLRVLAGVAALLASASVAAMVLLFDPNTDPSRVYFGSDTHSFGLLIGVVLALLVTAPDADARDSWPRWVGARAATIVAWTLAPAAFIALVVLLFTLPDTAPITYRGGLVSASLLTACVVHNAIRDTGPVAALLRVPVLRWLGQRSFSLYLWHWPVVVFLRQWLDTGNARSPATLPDWAIGLLAGVITLVLSDLSYRWIETPFRRRGFRGVLRGLSDSPRFPAPAAVMAACLAAVLFAGVSLGTSPDKSSLEIQLEQLAQLQQQANLVARHLPPPQPAPATPTLPSGRDITGIGDSVMLASSQALTARFPGMYIDAQVSRHYSGGEGVIESLAASRMLRKYVVLGFGTNGQAFDGQLDRILREIGPGHKIVLLVPYGPVDGIPQAARQVLQYAPRHANVYLAPWCQAAAAHPENLGPDDVHPFGPGTVMYADAVTVGLRQAVTGRRDTSITCPI
ncbi:acyltransferase family protein [Gordonia oryzae]|uniref:acyltransferase family protein n=1 Tax=Gordonia oryzae TaxID=2487349 RepID=UPI001FE4CAD1|nr:acyltransferase family protein [Gordonia oryzae]